MEDTEDFNKDHNDVIITMCTISIILIFFNEIAGFNVFISELFIKHKYGDIGLFSIYYSVSVSASLNLGYSKKDICWITRLKFWKILFLILYAVVCFSHDCKVNIMQTYFHLYYICVVIYSSRGNNCYYYTYKTSEISYKTIKSVDIKATLNKLHG